jgi:glycosyltransferase involved in cell wall biosynthesis
LSPKDGKILQEMIDVIVPVYNEEEILPEFYRRITSLSLPLNLIFIDNASTDSSVDIMNTFGQVTLIQHKSNEGYGASIIDGINCSRKKKIIIIDADCEYPPEAIPKLLKKLDSAEIVYASRFLNKNSDSNMPRFKMMGNKIISFFFNVLFNQDVTDLYTGCKAVRRSALEGIILEKKGFEHVLEMGVKLARNGITIQEIDIDFTPRHTGRAKMKHFSETVKYCYLTLYYYLNGRMNESTGRIDSRGR